MAFGELIYLEETLHLIDVADGAPVALVGAVHTETQRSAKSEQTDKHRLGFHDTVRPQKREAAADRS
jgi:hypothetical protein